MSDKQNKSLTWFGHNCFQFVWGTARFLTDPFLAEGVAPCSANEIQTDYILVSHGHGDHCSDAIQIAKRNNATIITMAEMASFFAKQGVKVEPMNIRGAVYVPVDDDPDAPKGQILMTQAPHSSTTPNGEPGGNSAGFVLSFSQNGAHLSPDRVPIKPMKATLADAFAFSIYFACDSGYFSEMKWIGEFGIDVAVLPIGDRYTMGPALSLDAINALAPRYVVPSHYNTWSPIRQDVAKWADAVQQFTRSKPLALSPGVTVCEKDDLQWE